MKVGLIAFLSSSCIALSACASQGDTPFNGQTTANATPAVYVEASDVAKQQAQPIQYVPVPVPGQLMPVPTTTAKNTTPSFTSPAKAVDYANQEATEQPTSSNFFNAMMTYDYMPGALYTIYTAPLHITDITLAPGEKLISEAAGDTLRWQVAQTYSGQGSDLAQHILVKPSQPGLTNTMVITTDQRVYHLILQSTPESYMASVQWNYDSSMVNFNSANATNPSGLGASQDNNPDVDLNALNFNYQLGVVTGNKPAWYPVRVFNDGRQTYIELPHNYAATQLPVLFVADDNGKYGTMINWRYRAPYMIADTVIQTARLQTGVKSTGDTIVQIQLIGS